MGTDRHRFTQGPQGVPLYEGRMVAQYDHRAKGYRSGRGRKAAWQDLSLADPQKSIQPQWYIPVEQIPDKALARHKCFRVGWCDVGSPTNERTLVAALLPPDTLAGDTVPNFVFPTEWQWAYCVWLAVANTFVMDYLVRFKVSLHVKYNILDSLPFPRFSSAHPAASYLCPRVLRLTCAGMEMTPFWNAMAEGGWVDERCDLGNVPGTMNSAQRIRLQAEIDAFVAREVYGLTRVELSYIMDTFPIVKRKDEKAHGDYRTKLQILEIYDAMQRATDTAQPYQTLLNPPLPDPRAAHSESTRPESAQEPTPPSHDTETTT